MKHHPRTADFCLDGQRAAEICSCCHLAGGNARDWKKMLRSMMHRARRLHAASTTALRDARQRIGAAACGESLEPRMLLAAGAYHWPAGNETRINAFTSSYQSDPSIGMDDAGNYVIAWDSNLQDGDYAAVYAQRFNASGVAQGSSSGSCGAAPRASRNFTISSAFVRAAQPSGVDRY